MKITWILLYPQIAKANSKQVEQKLLFLQDDYNVINKEERRKL